MNIAGPADKPDVGKKQKNLNSTKCLLDSPVDKLYMGEREVPHFAIELALYKQLISMLIFYGI